MTETDVVNEIKQFIQDAFGEKRGMDPDWLLQQVLDAHPLPNCASKSWHQFCSAGYLEHCVKRALRDLEPETEPLRRERDKQLVMDGFKHLQRGYLIVREGKRRIVGIQFCNEAELLDKATQYDSMASGCTEHANELRRYVKDRLRR